MSRAGLWLVVFLQIDTETPQVLPSSEKQRFPWGCQNTLINETFEMAHDFVEGFLLSNVATLNYHFSEIGQKNLFSVNGNKRMLIY